MKLRLLQEARHDRPLVSMVALFILSIFGILLYTIITLQEQTDYTLRIDLAGRQRFLSARHFNEIMLARQALQSDYLSIRQVFSDTLEALIHGGPALIRLDTNQLVRI